MTLELRSVNPVLSTSSEWALEPSEGRKFCPRGSPETGEGAEQRPGRHTHCATHDEAHLHAVEAAGLGLPVGTHGHRHLVLRCDRSARRLTPNARRRALAVRGIASGAQRSYFREHGLRTCKRRGWWALWLGTCCCEPLGGGRRWRLPPWPWEGPRCPPGDCACAL